MTGRTTIVVGGSVGGLMAAHALRAAGIDVTVLERSASALAGFGQGIRVQPAVLALLDLVAPGAAPLPREELDERRYFDEAGAIVHRVPEAGYTTHWNALFETLRGYPGLDYRLASTVTAIRQGENTATVKLAGDDELDADVVVFADGLGSLGRRTVSPGTGPEYAGYVAWRGTASSGDLDPAWVAALDRGLNIQLMPGSHIHVYPVPGAGAAARLFNFVWYRNVAEDELVALLTDSGGRVRRNSVPTGMLAEPVARNVRDDAARFLSPQIAGVVRAATPSVQAIIDVASDAMVLGRVALLGDAAFVARPHLGAGTAKAAEDAMSLAAALRDEPDAPAALKAWAAARAPASREIVDMSRALGERYQVTGTFPGDPEVERLAGAASRLARNTRSERTP